MQLRAASPVVTNAPQILASVEVRRSKLFLTLWIMGAGMIVALAWATVQGGMLGQTYPYDTFLFSPETRFSDLSDVILFSSLPNPYIDPTAVYPPFAWLCLRPLCFLPNWVSMVSCFYLGSAGLLLLLIAVLDSLVLKPVLRVLYSFLLMGLSYPILFCFDRGNIEIVLALLIAGALYFMARAKYILALLCLFPAISFKIYPAFLLVLFLRQRKVAAIIFCLLGCVFASYLALLELSLPLKATWEFYIRNLVCFTQNNVYENHTLESGSSPWNALKILLIVAGNLGLIDPVNFSFDDSFVRFAYALYAGSMILLAAGLTFYACLLEKQFLRCAMVLLLFLAVSAPAGGDYRLLYAGVALVLLIISKTKRYYDWTVLVLLALSMVPKKEIILAFAGKTETGYADVPVGVFFDPLFVLTALFLLLYDSRTYFNMRWTQLRCRKLIWTFWPRSNSLK